MVYYGQDYMLEDRSGLLTGSDFEDVNGRIRLTLRCTQATSAHASYMIFDRTHSDVYDFNNPLAVLDFGPNNTLGTVAFENTPHVPMKEYLTKVVVASGLVQKYHVKFPQLICPIKRIDKKVHSSRWPRIFLELENQA